MMEAAPVSTEWTGIAWLGEAAAGPVENATGAIDTAVGSGAANTTLIVSYLAGLGETGRAAQLCDELVEDVYSDWFLPSYDELEFMYLNLHAKGLGDFTNDVYWCSSENSTQAAYAWSVNFPDGTQRGQGKYQQRRVRAVRAFDY